MVSLEVTFDDWGSDIPIFRSNPCVPEGTFDPTATRPHLSMVRVAGRMVAKKRAFFFSRSQEQIGLTGPKRWELVR